MLSKRVEMKGNEGNHEMKMANRILTSILPRRSGRFVRQAVSLLLAAALTVQGWALLPPGEAKAGPLAMEGHGIEGDPYIVTSAEQLDLVRNDLGAWYALGNDIALTGNWTPIGNSTDEYGMWHSEPFTGHLDGGGHAIAGLIVDTGGTFPAYAGLFGDVGSAAIIENLTLHSPMVSAGGYLLTGAGALAGQLAGTVANVHVVGGSVNSDSSANLGGLVGTAVAGSRIEGSSSEASVDSDFGIYGGLAGRVAGGTVADSHASGNLYGNLNGGGLIGEAVGATISGSHASGSVTGFGMIGGLIGRAENSSVNDSHATGEVFASSDNAGGLIGQMSAGDVMGSYATGAVTGWSHVGGLIGQTSAGGVTDSHAAGSVSGWSQIGGLVGSAANGAVISRTYASGAVTGNEDLGGLIGEALNGDVELSFAEGAVDAGFGANAGGLIGEMTQSSVTDGYARGSATGGSQIGGLIGNAADESSIVRAYATGKVVSAWESDQGGLVGALGDGNVIYGYYDQDTTEQSDAGRGDPKSTGEMGRESTYAGWDFSGVWLLDDRTGYPALIAFDRTPPDIKSASVKNETGDRIELAFQEKVAADADVLANFLVRVNGDPAAVDQADGFHVGDETRTLTLALAEPIKAGQTVTVAYEAGAAAPLRDLAGNRMDDFTVTADNLVESKLEIVQLSPADDAENATAEAALTIVFSDAVTPAAGRRIELRKSADGRLVESFDADDEGRVTVAGHTVTIVPSSALAPLTGYYATVEAGAFRDAEDRPNMAIAGSSRWNFTTAADGEADWVYAGNAGLSDGAAGSPDLFHDNGKIYVAYVDRAHGDRITVMQYADAASGWAPVGSPGFSAGGAQAPSLFVDSGIPYVAYELSSDGDVQVAVMKFDGSGDSGWVPIGEPLAAGEDSDPSLFVDGGIPYVAYRGAGPDNKAMAARYDGGTGNWAPMGDPDGVSEGDSYTPSLFIDEGAVYLAYQDYVFPGFGATVLKYDALSNTWSMVGPRWFTNDFAFDTSLVIEDGTLYVAYENLAHEAAVMKFDAVAGQWLPVGTSGFSAGQAFYTSLDVSRGEPYTAYMDDEEHDRATVMKYTGSRWAEVGSTGFSAGMAAEPSIAFAGGVPYVAFEDAKNGHRISVMTYAANAAPTASGVQAAGTPKVGFTLTGSYTYDDAEGDAEGDSTFRWYTAEDAAGSNRAVIGGASGRTLTLGSDLLGKYILFEATPKARSGKLAGDAVSSTAIGPVTAADQPSPPLVIAYSPAAGAAGVAVDARLSLTFNESVSAVSGKQLSVRKQADGSLVESVDAANPADVSVTGATYGYRLSAHLEPDAAYYVLVDAGAFRNADGIDYAGIDEASAWTFTTAGEHPPAGSSNANLASLTLAGGVMLPDFRPDVVHYTANVPYPAGSVTVTAAVYDAFASMTVNGRSTISGTPVNVALGVGSNPIRVEVTAQDGTTKKTYTVNVTRAPDPGGDTQEEPDEEEPVEDRSRGEGFEVIVNGQRHERIASSKLTEQDGRSTIAVTVDASRLSAQIEDVENPTIVIPVSGQADRIYAELTGDAVDALSRKSGVLELQTPLGTYRIPAAELPVGQLSQSLGGPIDAAQLKVRLTIAQGDADKRSMLEKAAKAGDFLVVVPAVDFSVTVSYGGQSAEADRFDAYVEREIPLPDGADPSRITTAVVLESDGAVRHVPTYVSRRDGRYVAVVNSLTNSSYALILHSAAFTDMDGHWAEKAVADMGSRLIVSGMGAGLFDPDAPVTRAQFLSVMIRALGLSDRGENASFRDVADGAWYAGAAAKAAEYGLAKGYEDGTFRPDKTITRAEAFVIAASAMKLAGMDTGIRSADQADALSAFSDGGRIGAWAAPAAAAAVKQGLVRGYRGALHPEASLTRAETAVLLRTLLIQAGLIDDTDAS